MRNRKMRGNMKDDWKRSSLDRDSNEVDNLNFVPLSPLHGHDQEYEHSPSHTNCIRARQITFPNRIELKYPKNVKTLQKVMSNGIVFGDVNNDGENELVIGGLNGFLAIYKGKSEYPWKFCDSLGKITIVILGDVLNISKDVLVVISAEGRCYVFADFGNYMQTIEPMSVEDVPPNCTAAIIVDVDGDGKNELLFGTEDGELFSFVYEEEIKREMPPTSTAKSKEDKSCILVESPPFKEPPSVFRSSYKMSSKKFWSLEEKVTHFVILKEKILIGQDEGAYVYIQDGILKDDSKDTKIVSTTRRGILKMKDDNGEELVVTCNEDGWIRLFNTNQQVWEIQIDHELFALDLIDLTEDGNDEIIACAYVGMTFIVDRNRNMSKFRFEHMVSAFRAGLFSRDGSKTACFLYVTYDGRVFLYYDIFLPTIAPKTLVSVVKDEINIKWGSNVRNNSELVSLVYSCLHHDFESSDVEQYKEMLQEKANRLRFENSKRRGEQKKEEESL